MTDFWMKQNDTSPSLAATLKDADGAVVDLTNATVRFHMATPQGVMKIDAAAAVTDAANGRVRYDWDGDAGDTDTAGSFRGEWEVTFPDTRIETFPSDKFIEIDITEELA